MAGHTHTHEHDEHSHGEEEHGLAHVAPKKVLLGVGAILMVLTIITVAATRVDFGSQMNLVVALLIATVKATLVAMYFMHLRYDKPFHSVAIAGGLLAALLFVGFAFMDGNQYQSDICEEPGASCETWQAQIAAHKKAEAERTAPASDPAQPAPVVAPDSPAPTPTPTPAPDELAPVPSEPAPAPGQP